MLAGWYNPVLDILIVVSLLTIFVSPCVGLTQEQQFETYENDNYGFSIEYPSDWRIDEADLTYSTKDQEVLPPWESVIDDVQILAPDIVIEGVFNDKPLPPADLSIWVFELKQEEYLDTNDMTVKTRIVPNFTPRDLIQGWIEHKSNFWGSNFKTIRDNETTFGAGNYPAWKVDATTDIMDDTYFNSMIYSVYNGKIYGLKSSFVDLAVPEYLPILQRMIDSFHITN
jgi:hypothetical protein